MGVIKRINLLNKEESPDMTIEQLVIGALEEAFISMVKFTYHIYLAVRQDFFCRLNIYISLS